MGSTKQNNMSKKANPPKKEELMLLAAPPVQCDEVVDEQDGSPSARTTVVSATTTTNNDEENITDDKDKEQGREPPSKKNKSLTTIDRVVQHLQEEQWTHSVDREKNAVYTSATGDNGSFRIIIKIREQAEMVIVHVLSPVNVPQGVKRSRMAEFITRANYGMLIGNFEMDFVDGEVNYKGSIELKGGGGGELAKPMIQNLIRRCVFSMNQYFPGIMRIIYADLDAVEAIREIEPNRNHGDAPVEAIAVQVLDDAQQLSGTAVVLADETSGETSAPQVAAESAAGVTNE